MLQDLQWQPLNERRREIRLTLLFRIVHGKIAIPVEQMHEPAAKFRHISSNTQQYKNSFVATYHPTMEHAAPVGSECRQCLGIQDAAAHHAIDSGAHSST